MIDLDEIGFYTLTESRASQAASPKRLHRCEMIVTPRCNFKCPYCRGVDLAKDSVFDDAIFTLRMWAANGLRAVRFSGGEPTLYKRLPELCEMAKMLGVERIAVSSNGSAKREVYDALLSSGVNDFSISLDACCSASGEKMAGVPGMWEKVCQSIEYLSGKTYVTVGLVVTPDNLSEIRDTVLLAHRLGVADIRVIPAAQYAKALDLNLPEEVIRAHPVLAYRAKNFSNGSPVRGIECGQRKCWLVRDDMAVMGGNHYPCIIYMRERGNPIGKVGPDMLDERTKWSDEHDCTKDPICKWNCLDVCVQYNRRAQFYADNPTA